MSSKERSSSRSASRRHVNVRVLLSLLGACVVVGGLVHLLHGFQIDSNADTLKERAKLLQADGETQAAIGRYRQYVLLRPDDIGAWAVMGQLLDETAKTPRQFLQAYLAYEKVLNREPARDKIRRRQAEIAMTLRRYDDAVDHWKLLQKTSPDDGELEFQIGLCEEFSGQPRDAMNWYRGAIDHGHARPLVFLRMARLLRGPLDQPVEADRVIGQMMKANSDSAEAFRTRALYRRALGTRESMVDAMADARNAMRLAADDLDSLLLVAELNLVDPDADPNVLENLLTTMESRLKRTSDETKIDDETQVNDEARIYELLSRIHLRLGNRQQAIDALRRGHEAQPDRIELAWQLADLLVADGRVDEARKQLDRLRDRQAPEIPLLYLEARILMTEGEFVEARKRLQRVQSEVARESILFKFSGLHLGACYGRMGQVDEQLKACREVLDVDPNSVEAKLGAAAALESLGRNDEAIRIYQTYRSLPQVSLRLARLLLRHELRRPSDQRNWQPLEEALSAAESAAADSVPVALLRSEVLRVQGKSPDVVRSVASLRQDHPNDVRAWAAAAIAAMRDKDWPKSLEILDDAEQQLGDRVTLRLARAAYWSRNAGDEAEAALIALEQRMQTFPKNDQLRLLEGLATVHFLRNDTRSARRLWTEVAARYPDHVGAQFRLLRIAVALGEDAEVDRRLQEIRRIEGEDGAHVLVGNALHRIAQARSGKPVVLSEPQTLLIRAGNDRPGWSIVPLALAEVSELQGNVSGALKHYLRAIELENRDPAVLRRTVALLLSGGRVAEAKRLIAGLFDNAPISVRTQLRRLQVEVAIKLQENDVAVAQIPDVASADSKNYRQQLWRGRMLAATGQTKEAKTAFDAAVKLAPQQPDVWVQQVTFLARTGRQTDAESAVKQARRHLSGPGTSFALAQCYEAIGDHKQAEQNYLKLSATAASSIEADRLLVEFYLRTAQADKAEPRLTRLIGRKGKQQLMPADVFWVRRSLAMAKAPQDYRQFREALELLDQNISESADATVDRRLKARLLATRPHPAELRDAKRILESLDGQIGLLPEDRFLLASICDRLGEEKTATAHWLKLLDERADNASYLANYVSRLIRRQEADAAAPRLKHLMELEPDALRTLALRGRWHILQQQTDQALELLQNYVEKQQSSPDEQTARLTTTARVMEELAKQCGDAESHRRFSAAAEKLYQHLAAKRPENLLRLAMFLERAGRRTEALDRCEEAMQREEAMQGEEAMQAVPLLRVTEVAVAVVRHHEASEEQLRRVDEWLTQAVREDPQSIAPLVQLAEFRLSHERYKESVELYRNILQRNPNHIVALNNLAWLLSAWKGDHAAAEQLIQRAIDRAGPIPALLDTRGSISLSRGDALEAVNDFRKAVAQDEAPSTRFHLATAYWKSKNERAARFNFDKAHEAGLTVDDLYPLEQDEYQNLRKHLKTSNSPTEDN